MTTTSTAYATTDVYFLSPVEVDQIRQTAIRIEEQADGDWSAIDLAAALDYAASEGVISEPLMQDARDNGAVFDGDEPDVEALLPDEG